MVETRPMGSGSLAQLRSLVLGMVLCVVPMGPSGAGLKIPSSGVPDQVLQEALSDLTKDTPNLPEILQSQLLPEISRPQLSAEGRAAAIERLEADLKKVGNAIPQLAKDGKLPKVRWTGYDTNAVATSMRAFVALGLLYIDNDDATRAEQNLRFALALDLALEHPNKDTDRYLSAAFEALLKLYLNEKVGVRDVSELVNKLAFALAAQIGADKVRLPEKSQRLVLEREDKLFRLVPRFDVSSAPSTARCSDQKSTAPVARAVLIGNNHYRSSDHVRHAAFPDLRGSINDVELVEKALEARGAKKPDVTIIIDGRRDAVLTAMRETVAKTECGDFVLFHFSGLDFFASSEKRGGISLGFDLPPGFNTGLLQVDSEMDSWRMISGPELSEFVTAIRNRGANVFLFLDTGNAAGMSIGKLQALAAGSDEWSARIEPETQQLKTVGAAGLTPLARGAGAYAAFYASDINGEAGERPVTGSDTYGLFSYALSKVLQIEARPTIRQIAEGIGNEYLALQGKAEFNKVFGYPVFEASDPDLVFLEPKQPLATETLPVEILSPKLPETRGAILVPSPKFELIGRIPDSSKIGILTVNSQPVPLDGNGQFKAPIELEAGQNKVVVVATGRDFSIRIRTIEFSYEGDLNRFAAVGHRYALVIGIKNYDNSRWKTLATPLNDATDVAKTLRELFGFETAIEVRGQKRDLVLLDATMKDISTAIDAVRQMMTENDSLLIYYAGHGIRLQDNEQAYWIPKDGDSENELTWFSAADLIHSLKRMNARSVLVVSDSCFSGAMTRDAPDLSSFSQDKKQALLKAGNKRSRLFISSGGTEPVLDKGCKENTDHSIFACAFLKGLREFPDPVFGSRDFHQAEIFPIGGRTNQQPQFKEIADSGHDGGEFIFARIESQNAGRETPKP